MVHKDAKEADKARSEKAAARAGRYKLYSSLTKPAHSLMARGALLSAAAVLFDFAPCLVGILIAQQALASRLPDAGALAAMVAVAIVCAALGRALSGSGVGVCHRADVEFRVNARTILMSRFAALPLGWFSDSSSSEVKQAVSDDVLDMHPSVGHAPAEMTTALLMPLIPLVYLFFADWRLSLVFLAYLLLVIGATMVFMMRDVGKLNAEYKAANVELSSSVVEMVEGIEVVKAFGGTRRANERFHDAVEHFSEVVYTWTKVSAGPYSVLVAFVSPGVILALIGLASWAFVAQGWLGLGACIPFLVLAPGIPSGFVTLFSSSMFLTGAMSALEHLERILAVKPLPEPEEPLALPDAALDVRFEGLSFSYEEGGPWALEDVEAQLLPNTVCALVGDSGSGKTSFARMIPRFWDPARGAVLLRGHDLRSFSSSSLLSKVAVVFQESMLLSISVRDNIKLARPDASDEDMLRAAQAAQIHERIVQLPQGYDTIIGSSEGRLSGGEAQRVAIARAIVQDAPILVLDEATAHTDPENERAIQRALGRLAAGRTTIVIAHRLHTVVQADQILVMEAGRIVERGRHDELVAASGRYARLWKAQELGRVKALADKEDSR